MPQEANREVEAAHPGSSRTVRTVGGVLIICLVCLFHPPGFWAAISSPFKNVGILAYAIRELSILGIYALSLVAVLSSAFCPYRWKWPLFSVFAVSLLISGTYFHAVGTPLGYSDGVSLWFARYNTADAIGEYLHPLLLESGVIVAFLLGFALVSGPRPRAVLVSAGALVLSVASYATVCVVKKGGFTDLLPSTTSVYGILATMPLDRRPAEYVYTTEEKPDLPPAADHFALVIDESVRHDFFAQVVLPEIKHSNRWKIVTTHALRLSRKSADA